MCIVYVWVGGGVVGGARALARVCFDCVMVLCFVMGYVLQFK